MNNVAKIQLIKLAAAAVPYMGYASQQFLPIGGRREFSEEEQAAIDKGEKRWSPALFQSYGTPAHKLLANPGKNAILRALLPALGGAALGGASQYGKGDTQMALGAAGGAALFGVPVGLLAYFKRKSENEGIKDIMSRSPENATKRDIMSDPVYQRDKDRDHESRNQRAMMRQIMTSQALGGMAGSAARSGAKHVASGGMAGKILKGLL